MKEFPKKTFWHIMNVIGILVFIIFVVLIIKLFDRGEITFTDESMPDSPELFSTDPILGATSPSVVIIYFGNFACDGCTSISSNLKEIVAEYPNNVTVVWKDFPNTTLNSESGNAAIAARCAHNQNKFWDYHDLLMSHQRELGPDLYTAAAKELNLRENKFNNCVNGRKTQKLIDQSLDQITYLNLTTAPTLFINNKRYTGEMSQASLKNIIGGLIEDRK